jgi:hypothetical protein
MAGVEFASLPGVLDVTFGDIRRASVNLPSELFDEITGLGDLPPPVTEADCERRSHHRFAIGSRATICGLRRGVEGPSSIVLMRDVSVAGVGFLHNERMREGDAFVIRFAGKNGRQVGIRCFVNRCEAGGTGGMQFVIGATFQVLLEVKEPGPEEVADAAPARRLIAREPARGDTANYANKVMGMNEVAGKKLVETAALAGAGVEDPDLATGKANAEALSQVDEPKGSTAAVAEETGTAEVIEGLTGADAVEDEAQCGGPTREALAAKTAAQTGAPPVAVEPVAEVLAEKHKVTIAERLARSAPVAPVASAPAVQTVRVGNQEVLARVREHMLSHGTTVRSLAQQLEEVKHQLSAQKVMMAELAQQRDESQAAAAAARKQLAEVEGTYAKRVEHLEKELAGLNEMVVVLGAKSEADDKAVAELAALVEAVSGTALDASQINEHLPMPVRAAPTRS